MKLDIKFMPKDKNYADRWYLMIDSYVRSISQMAKMLHIPKKEIYKIMMDFNADILVSSQIPMFYKEEDAQRTLDWVSSLLVMNKLLTGCDEDVSNWRRI